MNIVGGVGTDTVFDAAVDAQESAYVVGWTESNRFPTTPGSVQEADPHGSGRDAFVSKLSRDGSTLLYSTYLGGATQRDEAITVKVDPQGHAYVGGYTQATDFPTTPGAFQASDPNGRDLLDGWVVKLSPDGSRLVYSTYFGGPAGDVGTPSGAHHESGVLGLDLAGGQAYVCGGTDSPGFPTTPGAYDTGWNGGEDAFAAKLAADGSALVFSTLVGGSDADHSQRSCAVDRHGQLHLGVGTKSTDYPGTAGAFQPTDPDPGGDDPAVTKLSADGSRILYSTYAGGPSERLNHRFFTTERVLGLDVDDDGRVWATGQTDSTDFPTTFDAFDPSFNGGTTDIVVLALEDDGSLFLSSYLGGAGTDRADGITVAGGHPLIAGRTTSSDFPTTLSALGPTDPDPVAGPMGQDAVLVQLNRQGRRLRYSTYFGGTGLDSGMAVAAHDDATAILAGSSEAPDVPTTPDAVQPVDPGRAPGAAGRDGFVAKIRLRPVASAD